LGKLGGPTDTERGEKVRCPRQKQSAVSQAREDISAGYAVDGARIEESLKPQSLVPARVRFSLSLESG
jgi:hypothetical protein